MSSQELIQQKDVKKRSASSFIISNFFNGPLSGKSKIQQPKLSALSTEAQNVRVQNLQVTPGTNDFGNHS